MRKWQIFLMVNCLILVLFLLVFKSNFKGDVIEVYPERYFTVDALDEFMKDKNLFDYLSDVSFSQEDAKFHILYGNPNFILHDKKIETEQIFEPQTILMGKKRLKDYRMNPVGQEIKTALGQYEVVGLVQGDDDYYLKADKEYMTDLLTKQVIYISLVDINGNIGDYGSIANSLKNSYGIPNKYAIYYQDIEHTILKLLVFLIFILIFTVIVGLIENLKTLIVEEHELEERKKVRNKKIATIAGIVLLILGLRRLLLTMFQLKIHYRYYMPDLEGNLKNIQGLFSMLNRFFSFGFSQMSLFLSVFIIYLGLSVATALILVLIEIRQTAKRLGNGGKYGQHIAKEN